MHQLGVYIATKFYACQSKILLSFSDLRLRCREPYFVPLLQSLTRLSVGSHHSLLIFVHTIYYVYTLIEFAPGSNMCASSFKYLAPKLCK